MVYSVSVPTSPEGPSPTQAPSPGFPAGFKAKINSDAEQPDTLLFVGFPDVQVSSPTGTPTKPSMATMATPDSETDNETTNSDAGFEQTVAADAPTPQQVIESLLGEDFPEEEEEEEEEGFVKVEEVITRVTERRSKQAPPRKHFRRQCVQPQRHHNEFRNPSAF